MPLPSRRGLTLAALGMLLSSVAVVVLVQLVDTARSLSLLSATNAVPLLGCLGIVGLEVVIRAWRWQILLPTTPASAIPVRRLVPVLLVGYLGNVLLPARLGEAVRAYLVAVRERVAFSVSFGTIVLERVLDLTSLAALAWIAAALTGAEPWIAQGTAVAAVIGLVAATILVLVRVERIAGVVTSVLGDGSLSRRAGALLSRFGEGAGGQPRATVAVALLVSASCWLLDGTIFWLCGQALGVAIPWPTAFLIGAITVLGTAIPSAPGYIGTFELAAVAAGVALGVPAADALALAMLAHAVTVLPLALGGALALVSMSIGLATGPGRPGPLDRLARVLTMARSADGPEVAVSQDRLG